MGALDRLQAAGFSQAEMAGYATQQHQALAAGGFSPQEISEYLGGQVGPPAPPPDAAEANASFAQNIGNHVADTHNLINVGTGKDALQTMKDVSTVYGPVEAAMNLVTGTVTGLPAFAVTEAARVAKILGAPAHITDTATQWAETAANALTYQPHTEAGQRLASTVNLPFTTLSNAADVAAPNVAQMASQAGAGQTASALTAEVARVAIDTLPMILGGELVRKMGGQRIDSTDMQNVAKLVAGPDVHPDTVQSVESSLRATYAQTGIGPYTVLEQSRINPDVEADLKNPEVSVPTALQPYMRREQIGVPVSDAMKAVRPLEAETPVPAPVELPAAEAPQPATQEAPGATEAPAGATPEPTEVAAEAPGTPEGGNVPASVPEETPQAEGEKPEVETSVSPDEQRVQAYEEGTGNITLLHSGLNPTEAIENLKVLGSRMLQTDTGEQAAAVMSDAVRDVQMKTTPMAAGSSRAMVVAKDAANAMRKAAWQWGAFDDLLKRGYTKEQRERMWNAADEENDLRTQGIADPTRGLGSLTDDERGTVETLSQYGNQLLQRARDTGMFQGEGVAYWTPRMVAMIGEDGEVSVPPQERAASAEGRGGNIKTTAGSLKGRQHATTAETEAAAQAKFGAGATVVRDIRTMPLAMARIEKAIAGRELVNRIKDIGQQLGQETVSASEKPEFFTLDHPAFKTYRAAGEQWISATEAELSARGLRAGNGKIWKSNPNTVSEYDPTNSYRITDDGKIERRVQTMERVPLYVSKEFEGPLKAIMTEPSGKLYQAFMGLKGKTMGIIMYSPLIHNMVEWGRALPMMPGKVLTGRIYFEGNAAKHDPITMRRAIDGGLVPIGHRFFNQDITGLLEQPSIQAGRSLTAKALGGVAGLVNEGAGDAVKAAIDKAGDVWHNTLLWDRVADLQMGLYTNLERDMIGKGLDPQTASRMAAHFANRYAGALPNEAMSSGARKLANLSLFSRTFTLGNIGAMKDMLTGLPRDVQAQVLRDAGEAARTGAVKVARQKAIHAFVTDIGLLYVGNAVMQNAMDVIMRDKTLPQILQGYATRFKDYLTSAEHDPSQIFNIGSLFPQSHNEPGKENRIFFNTAPDGTALYVRLPTGKIGEEMQGYITHPLQMLKDKQGTIARPLFQTLANDKGFGQKVYDDQAPGLSGMLHAVGNVAWNILQEQIPTDSIQAGYRLFSGQGDDTDALKTVGPLLGLTFSKGAPGGPEVGVMFNAEERHQDEVARAMPEVKQDIKDGDVQGAVVKMEAAHFTPEQIRSTLKYATNPQARLNRQRLKTFQQIAPMDDLQRMEDMQQEQREQQEQEEQQSQSTTP